MEYKSVSEMASRYDKMTLERSGRPQQHEEDFCDEIDYHKLCSAFVKSPSVTEERNIFEELEDHFFMVPRIDDLSSSDDSDDDVDPYIYQDDSQALNSMACAIQSEFIRKIPTRKPTQTQGLRRSGMSAFRALNSCVSASNEAYVRTSERRKPSPPKPKSDALYVGCDEPDTTYACSSTNALYETIGEAVYTSDIVTSQNAPTPESSRMSTAKAPPAANTDQPTITSQDLPRNALVLFLGCVQMTSRELRDLDLSRCISTFISGSDYNFVLLKIQNERFVIEDCDATNQDETSAHEKLHKRKQRKSPGNRMKEDQSKSTAREDAAQEERKSSRKAFLSCMGFTSTSKYQQLLQHNDSIHLKSYEGMRRRKKTLEFEYKRIIFCGAEITNMPDNMLTWVYHVVKGNYSAVECYAVECDDHQHARLLARALGSQIATCSGR